MKVPKWLSKFGATSDEFNEKNEVELKIKEKTVTVRCSKSSSIKTFQVQVRGYMPKPFMRREQVEDFLQRLTEANKL